MRLRLLAALAAPVLALVLLPPPPAQAAAPAAQLVVAPRDGGVLGAKDDLVVDVTVANTGDAPLPAGELAFSLDPEPLASASALLTRLAEPQTVLLGQLIDPLTVRTGRLAVGTSERVTARIDRDKVDAIMASATGTPAAGTRILYTRLRTSATLPVVGKAAVTRMSGDASVGFGTVVPITAPAGTTGVVDVATQETLTAQGGAWDGALRAAEAMRSATIALDPEVVASIRLAGDAAPSSATRFLEELAALPNPVVRLPYADGDLTLQHAAGVDLPLAPTSFAGSSAVAAEQADTAASPTAAPTPSPTTTATAGELTEWDWSPVDVAWPVPGTTDPEALTALGDDGRWVLLGSGDLRDTPQRVAGGPRARVGDTGVLVADATVSGLLATATAGGATGDAALATLTGVLASDAVSGDTRAVLAVPSRTASPGGLPRILALLAAQGWIDGEPVQTLTTAGDSTAVRLQDRSVPAARVADARPLVAAEAAVRSLGRGIAEPGAVTGPARLALLAMLSASWRVDDTGWRSATSTVTDRMQQVLGGVVITSRGRITAFGTDGGIQVDLLNRLTEPVTVRVRGTAANGRLRLTDDDVTVTIPASGGGHATLRAQTITNGRTSVSLQLLTRGGVPLGAPVTRVVTVRAGFDTVVAVLLLVALGGLLAVGVYRNVKRRTRKRA